jgi:DNA-binding IscR family transcriptional regulator
LANKQKHRICSPGFGRTKAVASLAKAGLIVGATGPGNGYRLARPAKDIRLLDVVEAVGWSLRLELPAVPVKDGDDLHRRLQAACEEAAEAGRAVLRAVSLANLLGGNDADWGDFR